MNKKFVKRFLFWGGLFGLLADSLVLPAHASGCAACSAGAGEQTVQFHLSGVAMIAGTANVTVSYGGTNIYTTISGGSVAWSSADNRYEVQSYSCAQWSNEIVVDPKLDEPVTITYDYDANSQDAAYTDFESFNGRPDPYTYYSIPGSPCLKILLDGGDGQWVETSSIENTVPTPGHFHTRIKGSIPSSAECLNIGDSSGPTGNGDSPVLQLENLIDSAPIGPLDCSIITGSAPAVASFASPASQTAQVKSAAAAQTTIKAGSVRFSIKPAVPQPGFKFQISTNAYVPFTSHSSHSKSNKKTKGKGNSDIGLLPNATLTSAASFASLNPSSPGNGYSLSDQIGRLRFEMSLGTFGRTLTQGSLIYQNDGLDNTAYSTANLRLADGSDPLSLVYDSNGLLRQIQLAGYLLDITTIANGFVISEYPNSQVGSADPVTGIYSVSGTPLLTWTVDNPDAPSYGGRVRFTEVQGTNSVVHTAQWQGTNGVSGTMTINRFGGKWEEVRSYSMSTDGTQRTETTSYYKLGVLQHKTQEVFQEFYNWGNPGDVYEGMVQHVEDPDLQALTTSFIYYDQTSQPPNMIYQATYPDGYSETIPTRLTGTGISPIATSGDPLGQLTPYKDNNPGSSARQVQTQYTVVSSSEVTEYTTTTVGGQTVGVHHVDNLTSGGIWEKSISDSPDSESYTFQDIQVDISTRRTIFTLDAVGKTETTYYFDGFWNTNLLQFGVSGIHAHEIVVFHGSAQNQYGVANVSTVDVSVEDQYGHVLTEDTYVSDGTENFTGLPLISHKINFYTDSCLTSTYLNGRLTYQASYNPDGTLQLEQDETGRQTSYLYDELKRVQQRTVKGRGGDADQVTTYDYDAYGNITTETTIANGLTNQVRRAYDLAGQLIATVGADGLTNTMAYNYTSGYRVVTETLPTQSSRTTSYFKDRRERSLTGNAAENEFYNYFLTTWFDGYQREVSLIYHDSALTQLKQATAVDWLGNEILFQVPSFGSGYHNRFTYYDDIDGFQTHELVSEVSESGHANRLSDYDEFGRLADQGYDVDGNGVLNPASTDQMMSYSQYYTNDLGVWQEVSATQRYLQNGDPTPTLVQRSRNTVPAALETSVISSNSVELPDGGISISSVMVDTNSGNLTTLATNLESGQSSTRIERDGLVRSMTVSGIGARTYIYTALGELQVVNDPVNGSTTNAYDPATRRLVSVSDGLGHTTAYAYFPAGVANAGLVSGTQDAAGNWTYNNYNSFGQLYRQWGVNIYPVQQVYDYAGRMTNMTTFRTSGGAVNWASSSWPNPPAGDSTAWVYDPYSGLLAQKIYADNNGVSFGYDANNILNTKTNGRNQVITYSINGIGQLTNTAYSDGTPAVAMTYDRAGRLQTVTDASGTRTVAWTDRDQMGNESYTNGLLAGVTVNRGYDAEFRPSTVGLSLGGTVVTREHTVFDGKSWVNYINDETPDGGTVLNNYDYTFQTNTPFVQAVAFSAGGNGVLTQNYSRDGLGRISGATATVSGSSVSGVNYLFDALNRRTEADLVDGTKWNYGYDNRSEVTSGKRQLASGAMAGGEQYEYNFDDIGNRTLTKAGGDGAGNNLRVANYTNNQLNQITSRDVPGSIWLVGEAPTNLVLRAVVQSGLFGLTRQDGQRFYGEAVVSNSTAPVYAKLAASGAANGAVSDVEVGHRLVAQTPENFSYDNDGNMTQDGLLTNGWDAEDRAVEFTSLNTLPAGAQVKVDCVYDGLGRRVQKVVSTNNGTAWVPASTNRFVYDGWNLIAILDGQSTLQYSFSWGLDLSGTGQGAGGVGGLLGMTVYSGPNAGSYYYSFDGNGNVLVLINAGTGTIAAQYEYDPFGQITRTTGVMAKANPFRFSTKYEDDETSLDYYGYRFYNPNDGRWLNREPLGEAASANLMSFIGNNGLNSYDVLGLYNSAGHFYTTYLVALAAGYSKSDAFTLAYWSQYPDQDPNFDAAKNFFNLQWEVGRYLHSLTGGDPYKLRKYLECLLKSGQFNDPKERGMLIHALGDAFAHTYSDPNPTLGPPKQLKPNPNYGRDVLYPPGIGHGLAGHLPDYIASAPNKYDDYVDQLYSTLKSLNPAATSDYSYIIGELKDAANSLPSPNFSDAFSTENQNDDIEVNALRELPDAYNGSYNPDDPQNPIINGMRIDEATYPGFRDNLINKIKKGVKGCCPNN